MSPRAGSEESQGPTAVSNELGAVCEGAVSHRAVSQGAVCEGAVSHRAVSQGAMCEGAMCEGAATIGLRA
ncbi:hypothetical protein GCM10023074_03330 [Microbispora amethystogenes]|uniref:Uncharacterized protein n=1 Tax=Microbispora amethystogenes TaxID=1427754 RepID=A0ABQ4F5H0_9ACTN|nr:hypothetical protein Mam01_02210 [Microbispora amethystogenes]